MTNSPETDTSELDPYLDAAWQLIPLHRWDYCDQVKGKTRERGKSPFDNQWTTKPYKNADQVEHMKDGANVGVFHMLDLVCVGPKRVINTPKEGVIDEEY